jgi:hypothetical protein
MGEGWTLDYLMSLITLPNVLGATGAVFYVVSMSMKTAIPLRIASLVTPPCRRSTRLSSACISTVHASLGTEGTTP